ncbi:diacylglycerol acyltransferase, putative, partial [Bodo saltans]
MGFTFDIVTDVLLLVFWVKYESMFRNKPQESGSLRSPWVVSLFERHIIPDVERYFNVKLVMDGTQKDDGTGTPNVQDKNLLQSFDGERVAPCLANANNRYIFSYHPHGVFPGTALILPFTEQWRCHLGWNALHCVTVHAAGIIFNVPMVRDFLLRLGGRVVTRSALESSLEQGNSVMIVTGGQTEMLHTKYSDNEMHLVTHHHGFLKLAIKHQVPAVPLVCFAENNVMDNIHVPWLQKRM